MRFMRVDLGLKVAALFIAVVLWIAINGETNTEFTVSANINYSLPENLAIASTDYNVAQVTLRGPLFVARGIKELAATFNLIGSRPGRTTITIPKSALNLPRGIEIVSISPSSMELLLEKAVSKQVNVIIVTHGESAKGYEVDLSRSKVNPTQVLISGARSEIAKFDKVFTQPIDIASRKESFASKVSLDLQGKGFKLIEEHRQVEVQIFFKQALAQRSFEIPVKVINTPYQYQVEPSKIALEIEGPENYVTKMTPGDVEIIYNAKDKQIGRYRSRLQVRLPQQIKLLSQQPTIAYITLNQSE